MKKPRYFVPQEERDAIAETRRRHYQQQEKEAEKAAAAKTEQPYRVPLTPQTDDSGVDVPNVEITSSAAPSAPQAPAEGEATTAANASGTAETPESQDAVEIPEGWQSLPWPKLRSLASKVSNDPIINQAAAVKAINEALARRQAK